MGDHNIILQSQRPNICLFLPFDPQSDSKSKSKSQRCDQRPDMLSTVLEILDWTQIFEATHRAIVKKRIGGAVVEHLEQWWSSCVGWWNPVSLCRNIFVYSCEGAEPRK